jgi:hypothetical protein
LSSPLSIPNPLDRPPLIPPEAGLAFVTANASPTGVERGTDPPCPKSWRLLSECDLTQATTNSYTCQPQEADHPITYALRSARRSPEASEPHLRFGFRSKTQRQRPGRSHQLESSRPAIGRGVTVRYCRSDHSTTLFSASDGYPPLATVERSFNRAPSGMTPASR